METKEQINQVVIQALSEGEITGDELHEKIWAYSATDVVQSFLYLLNEGYMVQTKTGFKLTPQYRVRQELVSVLHSLGNIHASIQSAGLNKYGGLNTAVCDAITAIQEACVRTMDAADE